MTMVSAGLSAEPHGCISVPESGSEGGGVIEPRWKKQRMPNVWLKTRQPYDEFTFPFRWQCGKAKQGTAFNTAQS